MSFLNIHAGEGKGETKYLYATFALTPIPTQSSLL